MRGKLAEFVLLWIAGFVLCCVFGKLDVLICQGGWLGLTVVDVFMCIFFM